MVNSKLYNISDNKILFELFYESKTTKTSFYYELTYVIEDNEIVITKVKPVKNVFYYLYDNVVNKDLNEIKLSEDIKYYILRQIVDMYLEKDKSLNDYYKRMSKRNLSDNGKPNIDSAYESNKKLLRKYMIGQQDHEKQTR